MSDLSELESRLVGIWESVLGERRIGVNDSFWDLGGNSLMALRLLRRVEQFTGENLPVSTLLEVPTIRQMAALLRRIPTQPWSSLVAIQPQGSKPPLFCVHAMVGLAEGFRPLANHLGSDQPVYGLQAKGVDGRSEILNRLESMANRYIEEVRRVQPSGPYHLAGRCFGGWVAYEMAQQFYMQGDEVAIVVLLDTYFLNWSTGKLVRTLLRRPPFETFSLLVRKSCSFVQTLPHRMHRPPLPRRLKQVRDGLREAAMNYVPRPYKGRVILFQADQKSLRDSLDLEPPWETLVEGAFRKENVLGNHNTMLTEPNVAILAQRLQSCLEQVRREQTIDRIPRPRDARLLSSESAGVSTAVTWHAPRSSPPENIVGARLYPQGKRGPACP